MHQTFMKAALTEAINSHKEGGIPIGSVLVHQGRIISRGHNMRVQEDSAILHADLSTIENAGRMPVEVYQESILYTTLAPCHMCAGAILLYKIPHVVIGENKNFKGAEQLLLAHGVKVEVLNDQECFKLMHNFINTEPELWYEDIAI
jgi:creatinine deaminase